MNKRGVRRYFNQYEVSNIRAMIRNGRRDPESCTEDFRGRLVVISGATSGIGYHTARKYASHGARLICINRNREKSVALKAEIENEFGVRCDYILADLSDLDQARQAAEELLRIPFPIDVLIHNAGIYLTRRELTREGFDKVFVVNHLSSLMINMMLCERMKSQGSGRIILVSSEGHRFAAWGLRLDDLNWEMRRYSGLKSYGAAKLAQLQCMMILDELFCPEGVTINAMHPGAVRSNTGKENGAFYRWTKKNLYERVLRPTQVASEALYYLGVSKKVDGKSGSFFNLTTWEDPAPPAVDHEAALETWRKSMEMVGLTDVLQKS